MFAKKMSIAIALLLASTAAADQKVIQIRSEDDPAVPPDPAFCATAPFTTNLVFNGSVWTFRERTSDGTVVNDSVAKRGDAHACARLANFAFTPLSTVPFLAKFNLPQGQFTGLGVCTIIARDVPRAGVITAACALRLTSFPSGVLGGTATSISIFNPFRLPGFKTGSYWTLYLFTPAAPPNPDDDGQVNDNDTGDDGSSGDDGADR
jgi:hypothetical protein